MRMRDLAAEYAEDLPAECPPTNAHEDALEEVFRLIPQATASAADFASKQAMGEVCAPGSDSCSWASCSLYFDIRPLRKFKRLNKEKPFVARLAIPQGVGRYIVNEKTGHIDFWRFSGNCLSGFVLAVEGPTNG